MENFQTATLIILRTFDVPPAKLFEAWINQDIMKKWFFTSEYTNIYTRCDPRIGGTFEILDFHDDEDYYVLGKFKEIEPPQKLRFTFKMPHINESEDHIEVQIKPSASGCKMTFIQEIQIPSEIGLTDEEIEMRLKEYHDQTEEGWGYIFDELSKVLEKMNDERFYGKMLGQDELSNSDYFNSDTNHESNI